MSGLFSSLGISGSGIAAAQTWINTAAGNIANANDVVATNQPAYATQTPIFSAVPAAPGQIGQGVTVSSVQLGDTNGELIYEPDNKNADKNGQMRQSDVNLGGQMVGMIQAQEDYQANANAFQHAKQAYQAALTLGS